MPRRILHYSPGPSDFAAMLDDRAVAGAWFELHRQGGCGPGELRLRDEFPDRDAVRIGDWIAFEYDEFDRWYLGRVEHRQSSSPAGITLRLEGMGVELNEVFPGGFGLSADGQAPHRYARTDLFPNDPDYLVETLDSVDHPHEAAALMIEQYAAPRTHIVHNPLLIEAGPDDDALTSLKFRGEESARSAIKELALRARNASWGVDETGAFFFLQPRTTLLATWREGRDLLSLAESCERDNLFNRVLLTGDYVYDAPVNSEVTARGFYRWRGNYVQPASRHAHGERRIRLWIPWIRTKSDSRAFVREFFRVYAQPTTRYLIEVAPQATLPRPWLGRVRLEDRFGIALITTQIETIRVQFDHAPKFRVELGPPDPRTLWPEPPHDERWEIPAAGEQGGDILTDPPSSESSDVSSDPSSDESSDISSDPSSELSSDSSLALSSDLSSESSSDPSSDASSEPSDDASTDDPSSELTDSSGASDATSNDSPDPSDSSDSADSSLSHSSDSSHPSDSGTSHSSNSSDSSHPSDSSCSCDDDWSAFGNLLLWLEADALTGLADGDPVASWPDQSGNGNDAAQSDGAKMPAFRANAVNGLPAVDADGSNDEMELPDLDLSQNNKLSIICVVKLDSTSTGNRLLMNEAFNGWAWFLEGGAQKLGKIGVSEVVGHSVNTTDWHLLSVVYDGATAKFRRNGAELSQSYTATFDNADDPFWLFSQGPFAGHFDGKLACLLVYDETLSTESRDALESCLACKYAIDLSP